MNNLKESNIIVTGATGGIGNSIIKKLYETSLSPQMINVSCLIFFKFSYPLQFFMATRALSAVSEEIF